MTAIEFDDFPRLPGEAFGEYFARGLTAPSLQDHFGAHDQGLLARAAEFCRTNNARPGFGAMADLWGYGRADIAYLAADGEYFIHLVDLMEPTGLGYRRLIEIAEEMAEEDAGYDSTGHLVCQFPRLDDTAGWLFTGVGVMRLFMSHSPWAKEWFDAVEPLMTHAMVHSGLMDKLGALPTYRVGVDEDGNEMAEPTGESAAQAWTKDLPSEEVARHQAFRGPLGGIEDTPGSPV